jgi:hypothetical protein
VTTQPLTLYHVLQILRDSAHPTFATAIPSPLIVHLLGTSMLCVPTSRCAESRQWKPKSRNRSLARCVGCRRNRAGPKYEIDQLAIFDAPLRYLLPDTDIRIHFVGPDVPLAR